MTSQRSLSKSRSGSNNSDSATDLPQLSNDDADSRILKRKQLDDIAELKKEISAFRKEMMSLVLELKQSTREDIQSVKTDIISEIKDELSNIKSTTDNLAKEQISTKKKLTAMEESLNFQSGQHEALCKQVDGMNTELNTCKSLQEELKAIKLECDNLRSEYLAGQQRERLLNLEISGVPVTPQENIPDYVLALAKYAGVDLSMDDVIFYHRVRTFSQDRPKNIIIRLSSQLLKDKLISGIRRKKSLTTKDIGLNCVSRSIYVNEHLIPEFKVLFKNARESAKINNYKHVWVRNCKIYVRKDDSSPMFLIKNTKDLGKIK